MKKEQLDATDMEKYGGTADVGVGYTTDENAVHKSEFTAGDSVYAGLQRFAGRFGVEQRGIERVPSDERTDTSMTQVGTLVRGTCLGITPPGLTVF